MTGKTGWQLGCNEILDVMFSSQEEEEEEEEEAEKYAQSKMMINRVGLVRMLYTFSRT